MPLAARCRVCRKKTGIQDESWLGRFVGCPHCGAEFSVDAVSITSTPVQMALETSRSRQSVPDSPTIESIKPPSVAKPAKQELLDRFEIRNLLGEGTYGKVYRAFDPLLDREVALKIPKFSHDQERRQERFLREAKAAARLRHPNIVGVHESGRIGEHSYIASEFIDGKPLTDLIDSGELTFDETARICVALAEGLAYAHDHGVIHRDIKPGNVLMDSEGQPQIADFGLAKRLDEDATMTTEGGILGTPAYMPPEQARGQLDQIGPASDQYSLGVILYEMLTGKRPFDGPSHQIIAKVAGEDPVPAPRSIRSSVPRNLEAICLKSLEKDPDRRYRTTRDLADDLQRWREGRPIRARRASEFEYLVRWCKRNPVLSLSLAVSGGLILAAIGGAFSTVLVRWQEAENRATRETTRAEASHRQLAINEFERGRNYCEQGDVRRGLLWLARGLERLSPNDRDLEFPIRSYINSWLPRIHQLQVIIPHENPVNAIAFSPDQKLIFSGSGTEGSKGIGQLWRVEDGTPVGKPVEHSLGISSVAYHPSGRIIATGSYDKTVRLLDPDTGKLLHELTHPALVGCIAFSHDGKIIATGCSDNILRLWNVEDGKELPVSMKHDGIGTEQPCRSNRHVYTVTFSPDDAFLVTITCDYRTRVWDAKTGELKLGPKAILYNKLSQMHAAPDPTNSVAKGPDYMHRHSPTRFNCNKARTHHLTSSQDRTAVLSDASTGLPVGQILTHTTTVTDTCFSSDESLIATAGEDGVVKIWKTGRLNVPLNSFPTGPILHLCFAPQGRQLHTGFRSPYGDLITGWNVQSGEKLSEKIFPKGVINGISFSPDGKLRANTSGGFVHIDNMETGEPLAQDLLQPNLAFDVDFSPDGRTLAIGCSDGEIRFWNSTTREIEQSSVKCKQPILTVRFSPDGQSLVTVYHDGQAQIWGRDGTPRGEPIKHADKINYAEFHPKGDIVATAGDDSAVRFWNAADGTDSGKVLPLFDRVVRLSFSPDGKQLATCGFDRAVRCWDYSTLLPTAPPLMHTDNATRLDINPQGTQIASGSWDRTAKVWELPEPVTGSPKQISQQIERILGSRMSNDREIVDLGVEDWKKLNSSIP